MAGGTGQKSDLFGILGNILVDKDVEMYRRHVSSPGFQTSFPLYMVVRYLSMNQHEEVRRAVLDHQRTIEGLSDHPEMAYRLLMRTIPRTRERFTPYIRSGFPSNQMDN